MPDKLDIDHYAISVTACWLTLVSKTAQSPNEKNRPKQMCFVAFSLSLLNTRPIISRATIAATMLMADSTLGKKSRLQRRQFGCLHQILRLLLADLLQFPKFLALQHTDRQRSACFETIKPTTAIGTKMMAIIFSVNDNESRHR
jgi:hypothetical protein